MITPEGLANYIRSLEDSRGEFLEGLRKEALAEEIPIIRDETAALLKVILRLSKPLNVLEIGTATGYSALTMLSVMDTGHIDTIENFPERIEKARRNISLSQGSERITLFEGDAGKWLKDFVSEGRKYDLVFMDAAKGQYPAWLPDIKELLLKGGVLIADNVLQDGSISNSRFLIERRDRTIHRRLREFLFEIKHDASLESAVLTVGDGVSLSVKLD